MLPKPYEGRLRAWYLPACADISAPTVAEVAAGTELTTQMTADGVQPNHTENLVSTDMLTGFIRQSIGTEGLTFNLRFLRDFETPGTDTVWDLFDTRGKAGWLMLSDENAGDTAADRVQVFPADFGRRKRIQSGANAHNAFSVMVAITDDYDDAAVVAA